MYSEHLHTVHSILKNGMSMVVCHSEHTLGLQESKHVFHALESYGFKTDNHCICKHTY